MKISKNSLIVFLVGLLICATRVSPIYAIEGGNSAEGSEFVVPIYIQVDAASGRSCSGALLAPTVVATAGHCVLDASGLLSSRISVGEPGSPSTYSSNWKTVEKIYIDDEYKGGTADGKVSNSDIAFLLLDGPLKLTRKINLASENEMQNLRNLGAKLRVFGYGFTSDSGSKSTYPNYFDSNFQKTIVADPNQAISSSSKGNVCQGDSGGPVLSITPSKITLVGVVTGSYPSNYCSKKQGDGSYIFAFSVINRFANLATEAITESLSIEQQQNSDNAEKLLESEQLLIKVEELESELTRLREELNETVQKLAKSNALLSAFSKAGLKAISCSNQLTTKTIIGKKPICPKGFRRD